MDDSGMGKAGSYVYNWGAYWSSSLFTDPPFCAWCFGFNINPDIECYYRCVGSSVRPVTE